MQAAVLGFSSTLPPPASKSGSPHSQVYMPCRQPSPPHRAGIPASCYCVCSTLLPFPSLPCAPPTCSVGILAPSLVMCSASILALSHTMCTVQAQQPPPATLSCLQKWGQEVEAREEREAWKIWQPLQEQCQRRVAWAVCQRFGGLLVRQLCFRVKFHVDCLSLSLLGIMEHSAAIDFSVSINQVTSAKSAKGCLQHQS